MNEIADSLRRVSQWLDSHNATRDPEAVTGARVAKLAEEVGEVASAWLGVTGQNPRKGHTHSHDELQSEVLDVAVTALALWEHLDSNQGRVIEALADHVRYLDERGLDEVDDAQRMAAGRAELVAELRRLAEGWDHLAKPELARASIEGADRLERGDSSVRVGHTTFVVTDT